MPNEALEPRRQEEAFPDGSRFSANRLDEWTKKVVECTNRMSTDPEYLKSIEDILYKRKA